MKQFALNAPQVLNEARNKWEKIKQTTRHAPGAVNEVAPSLCGYSALDAIDSTKRENPDDLFWEFADYGRLVNVLIGMIDEALAPDSSYAQEMLLRNS